MKVGLLLFVFLTAFSLSSQAQCQVAIPSDAQAVKVSGIFDEAKDYWVCTHSAMQFKGDAATIFVEPRGKLILEGDSNTVYLKARAKFVVQGKGNKIIHQGWRGAEKDSLNELIKCTFIRYEYDSASTEGCPEFNKEDYTRRTYYIVQGEQTLIMDTLTIPQKSENVVKDTLKEEVGVVQNVKAEPKFEDIKEEELFVGEKLSLNNVLFDRGKYVLNSSSFSELNKLADLMKRTPKMKVQLEGHTDITGSDKQNMQLSKHRVLVVKHYLVEKGIKGNRIATEAFGSSKPLVENIDKKSRSLNRRVEMKILEL
jgi:outer membrane protein OmpA-like peptidoglycan-associated protein